MERQTTKDSGIDSWDTHWRAYADAASQNPAQEFRRRLILDRLALTRTSGPVRILEVGSGQGDFARDLAASRADVEMLGLDLSEAGCEMARRKVPGGTFLQRDLLKPLELPEKFRGWATHAVCSEVLEHVDDPVFMMANIRPYLAPGARLVVTVPAGPMSAFDRHIGHRRHFTPEVLQQVLVGAGYGTADVSGAGFPFFNLYRLVVVARGEKLIADVHAGGDHDQPRLSWLGRAAMRSFGLLFEMNRTQGRRGWQLVAQATVPAPVPASP